MDLNIPRGSSNYPLEFFMVLASDHRTPATGLSPTVLISKAGGTWAAPVGTVTEIALGWYSVAANQIDVNTIGPLFLSATDPSNTADPVSRVYAIIPALGVPLFTQNTVGTPLWLLLISSADHITGLQGITPTVQLERPGGAFFTPAGTITEVSAAGQGKGFYLVNPAVSDLSASGPLLMHWTGTGADPGDAAFNIAPKLLPSSQRFGNGPTLNALRNRVNIFRLTVPNQDADNSLQNAWTQIATNVPCSVQPKEQGREVRGDAIRLITPYRIMFMTNYGAVVGDQVQWTDDLGTLRLISVTGERNLAGRGAAFTIPGEEVV